MLPTLYPAKVRNSPTVSLECTLQSQISKCCVSFSSSLQQLCSLKIGQTFLRTKFSVHLSVSTAFQSCFTKLGHACTMPYLKGSHLLNMSGYKLATAGQREKNPDVLLEEHVTPEWDRIYVSVIFIFFIACDTDCRRHAVTCGPAVRS